MTSVKKSTPLIILGLDVGDPEAIRRWTEEGDLPTIASVMRRGCWGTLAGRELITEQGIWFSIFNGVSRGEHGYYYFRQLRPGTYDLELFDGSDANVPPVWSDFGAKGRRAAAIDVPDVFLMPDVPGVQLPNWAVHNIHPPKSPCAHPPELLREVRRAFGPRMRIDNINLSNAEQDRHIYRRLLERIKKKGALCRRLLARERFDLIAVVFAETHTGSHQFWKYRPELSDGDAPKYPELTHAIRDIYRAVDLELGLLLKELPDDSNVFVVSATGMEDHYPAIGLSESFCRELGYQATPERNARASSGLLSLARRCVPQSWRVSLSRHLPRRAQERLLADNFRQGTDWTKTTAFSIPSHYTGFFRVNLRGREPAGTIEPGAEYEALLARMENDLKQLVDPRCGEPAVRKVTRADVFGASPHPALPDLFVQWKPKKYFMDKLSHPRAELSQPVPGFFRFSEHSDTGFVAAAGPAVKGRGCIGDVSLLDLAPTFLTLMGESIPQKLTGRTIEAITEGAGLATSAAMKS